MLSPPRHGDDVRTMGGERRNRAYLPGYYGGRDPGRDVCKTESPGRLGTGG